MSKKPKLEKPLSFEWDEGNKDKNVIKHKVQNNETEEVFENEPVIIFDESHSQGEDRYLAYGVSGKGRQLVISFTLRGEKRYIRPIMSRDQDKKERELYKRMKRGDTGI